MASRGTNLVEATVVDINMALSLEDGTRYTLTCGNNLVRYAERDDTDSAPPLDAADFDTVYPHNEKQPPFPRSVTPEADKTIYAWAPFGDARLSAVEG